MSSEYKEETKYYDNLKTQELLNELPALCREYDTRRGIGLTTKTRYNYAFKMHIYLKYLCENNEYFIGKEPKSITPEDLMILRGRDAQIFAAWIEKQHKYPHAVKEKYKYQLNSKSTVKNYIASLSAYWTFMCRNDDFPIESNPWLTVELGTKQKKPIIYLKDNEAEKFENSIANGIGLSDKQMGAHKKNMIRELCIYKVLINTGIRVSELVGLNVTDIDFDNCMLHIQRKGDHPDHVYFSDEVKDILLEYLEIRKSLYQPSDDENALFLVGIGKYKGNRLSVRSVQLIIKKYAKASSIPNPSTITPHKMRSSFAMKVLKESGNIELTRSLLGHESISSTQFYARAQESEKEENRNLTQN